MKSQILHPRFPLFILQVSAFILFFLLPPSAFAALSITNSAATNIQPTTAVFCGTLASTNGTTNALSVRLCYGTSDGLTNLTWWGYTNPAFTVASTGAFSTNITSLVATTRYYYRWYAIEGTNSAWSTTSNFYTTANSPTSSAPSVLYVPVMQSTSGIVSGTTTFDILKIGTTNVGAHIDETTTAHGGIYPSSNPSNYVDAGVTNASVPLDGSKAATDLKMGTNPYSFYMGQTPVFSVTNIGATPVLKLKPPVQTGVTTPHELLFSTTDEGVFMTSTGANNEVFIRAGTYASIQAGPFQNFDASVDPVVAVDKANSQVSVYMGAGGADPKISIGHPNAVAQTIYNDGRTDHGGAVRMGTNSVYFHYADSTNYVRLYTDSAAYYFERCSNGVINIKTNSLLP